MTMKVNRRQKTDAQTSALYKISQPIINAKNAVKTLKIYNNKLTQYKLVA